MGLLLCKANADEVLPPALPDGYELRPCEQAGAAWPDQLKRLMDVARAPPDAPAAAALLAKTGEREAWGHQLLRRAHRRVTDSIPRSPHVVACVALSADCVVMPRFETSLYRACVAGQLGVGDILSICADVVRGVVFLAACGLVHTDLAPPNVALERVPMRPAEGQGRCAWRGVIIDLETLGRVRPPPEWGAPWASHRDTRPLYYAVARHHRLDDVRSRVDVVDELEAVGWTLLWAVCTATGTPFPLADPPIPSDIEKRFNDIRAAAKAAGRPHSWGLHPAETQLMHAKTALRALLAGQGPPRRRGGGDDSTGIGGVRRSSGGGGCSGGNGVHGGAGSGSKDEEDEGKEGKEGTPRSTPAAAPAAAPASRQPSVARPIMRSPEFAPVRAYFAALARVPRRAPVLVAAAIGERRGRRGATVWSDLVSLPPAEVDMLTGCLTLPAAAAPCHV